MGNLPPISKKQEEFLRAVDTRINLLTGSVRSGKTWISLIKWLIFVYQAPRNYEFLMCGKTLTSLKHNCLQLLQQIAGADNFTYSLAAKSGKLCGRTVWLEGANDERSESKIRGMTLGGAYVDELTLIPHSFFTMLLTRLSLQGAKLYATTNPDAPGHWVKKDIVDRADPNISVWKFLLTDNPYLPPDYIENAMREHSGTAYSRFILGEWTRAEGLIYPTFANNTINYIIDMPPDDIVQVIIGVDFGGNKSATVFEAVGFTRNFRRVVVLDEEYRPAATENPDSLNAAFVAFASGVKQRFPSLLETRCDSAEQILIRGVRNAAARAGIGAAVRNALKTPINDRIRLLNKLINTNRLSVMEGCTRLIGALRDAVWNEKAVTDSRLDDGTYDVDCLDALEYAIEPNARYLNRGEAAQTNGFARTDKDVRL